MEGDRWAHLAVQAYKIGALSFSDEERKQESWKLREAILLHSVERELYLDTYRENLRVAVKFSEFKEVLKRLEKFDSFRLPYLMEEDKLPEVEKLRQLWIAEFGDPDDPEVAECIQKTVDEMQKQ